MVVQPVVTGGYLQGCQDWLMMMNDGFFHGCNHGLDFSFNDGCGHWLPSRLLMADMAWIFVCQPLHQGR